MRAGNRAKAKQLGKHTYRGSAHSRCGTTLRYTRSGQCVHCSTSAGMSAEAKKLNRAASWRYRRRQGRVERVHDPAFALLPRPVKRLRTLYKYQLRRYWPLLTVAEAESEFARMLIAQAGRCAVCSRPLVGRAHTDDELCVDHCHETKRVRALLCRRCNRLVCRELTWDLCLNLLEYLVSQGAM